MGESIRMELRLDPPCEYCEEKDAEIVAFKAENARLMRERDDALARVKEMEAKIAKLQAVLYLVFPTEKDLDWLGQAFQRENPDPSIWWTQHALGAGWRSIADMFICVWEGGRAKTEKVQAALEEVKVAEVERLRGRPVINCNLQPQFAARMLAEKALSDIITRAEKAERERDEALAREAVLAEALGWIRDHCNTFSDNCNAAGMRGTAKVALASLSDRAKQMLAAIEALRIIARNTKAGVVNVWWVKDFADKAVRVMKETT